MHALKMTGSLSLTTGDWKSQWSRYGGNPGISLPMLGSAHVKHLSNDRLPTGGNTLNIPSSAF